MTPSLSSDLETDAGPAETTTPGQTRLWYAEAAGRGDRSHANIAAVRVRGAVGTEALAQALRLVIDRHDALHLRFRERRGRLESWLQHCAETLVETFDHRALPTEGAWRMALIAARHASDRPFVPADEPMYRAQVHRLRSDDHLVVLILHMLVSDGSSMALLSREFSEVACAHVEGRPARLAPALSLAEAMRVRVDVGLSTEAGAVHWVERFRDVDLAVSWPMIQVPDTDSDSDGRIRRIEFDRATARVFREECALRRVTPFAGLATAGVTLLHLVTGHRSLAFLLPIDNRPAPLRDTVGHFLQVVPCRVDLDEDTDLAGALAATARGLRESFANRRTVLDEILGMVLPRGELARLPSVMIAQNNVPFRPVRRSGLVFEVVPLANRSSKFDFSLLIRDGERLAIDFTHRSAAFDEGVAGDFAAMLRKIVETGAARPNTRLSKLLTVDAAHVAASLDRGAGGALSADSISVLECFRAAAAANPAATCLCKNGIELSYAETAAAIDRLAGHLAAIGVRPGDYVMVAAERSPAPYVALLGVFAVGAVFVPFDPEWPVARRMLIANDCGARTILSSHPADGAGEFHVIVHDTWLAPGGPLLSGPAPRVASQLNDAAYLIYTSGSTGQPRGVLGTHRALANLARSSPSAMALGPGARVAQFASLTVDAALWDVVVAITSGAALAICPAEARGGGEALADFLDRERITAVKLTPSVLQTLAAVPACVRTIIVAGEPCSVSLAECWSRRVALYNAYGPTEAGVWATLEHLADSPRRVMTVGRAIGGVGVSVREPGGDVLPRGLIGELWITGAGLALGYIGLAEATAAAFQDRMDAPDRAPKRWYRTGDRARMHSDGRVELLGRFDRQIKILGQRIQPEEIEEHLRRAGRNAAVFGVPQAQPLRLVALTQSGGEPGGDLAGLLALVLPRHMVPTELRMIENWPFGPGGKSDIGRLRAIAEAQPTASNQTDGICLQVPVFEPCGHLAVGDTRENRRCWLVAGRDAEAMLDVAAVLKDEGIDVEFLSIQHGPVETLFALVGSGRVNNIIMVDDVRGTSAKAGDLVEFGRAAWLLDLLRALTHHKGSRAQIWVLTRGVFKVRPADTLMPGTRVLLALVKVSAQEMPENPVGLVDMGELPAAAEQRRASLRLALGALVGTPAGTLRAVRDGVVLRRRLRVVAVPAQRRDAGPFGNHGVHLLFGGGAICAALARYIARNYRAATIVVASRRHARDATKEDASYREAIRVLQSDVEAAGGRICFQVCDVTDQYAVEHVVGETLRRFGPPATIVHLAGIAGGNSLFTIDPNAFDKVVRPKVQGLRNILRAREMYCAETYVVALSSTATFCGGFGSFAYVAANAVLEALIETSTLRACAIASGRWAQSGMAAGLRDRPDLDDGFRASLLDGFSDESGAHAIGLAAELSEPVVFVASSPLPSFEPVAEFMPGNVDASQILALATNPGRRRLRPAAGPPFKPSRDHLEAWIAVRIGQCLELEEVGAEDDLFALGGHSLNAAQLARLLSDDLGVDMTLGMVFRHTSPRALAQALRDAEVQRTDLDAVAATLLHVAALPETLVGHLAGSVIEAPASVSSSVPK